MKLIIQIPCLNEAATLNVTLADLPRQIPGISEIQFLVVDDGSTDGTFEAAKELGVHHVVRHSINRGLAAAFQTGLRKALDEGADIIVNTDADNQYCGADIEKLVAPILAQKADMVVGVRPIEEIQHFSWLKKRLQKLGSWVVRVLSGTEVTDVTSGFRAYTRECAASINLITQFSHTLETLIQMGNKNFVVAQVGIRVNGKLRESRLFRSMREYIVRSFLDIFRIYLFYRGDRVFTLGGILLFVPGFLLGLRFLYIHFALGEGGRIQSLILAAVLMIIGFQCFFVAVLFGAQTGTRRLLEKVLFSVSVERGPSRRDTSTL